jgi:hypothetical protein
MLSDKARSAVCVVALAALIGACTIIGCSGPAMDNIEIEAEVEQAATRYYNVYGEWPKSMEQLRAPRSGGDPEFTNILSVALAHIEPKASVCKITFATKPDGSLSIEVLGPDPGDKIREGLGIPNTKISHASQ